MFACFEARIPRGSESSSNPPYTGDAGFKCVNLTNVCTPCDFGLYCPEGARHYELTNANTKPTSPCGLNTKKPPSPPPYTHTTHHTPHNTAQHTGTLVAPEDAIVSLQCPEGHYCPTPVNKSLCPAGFVCPNSTVEPFLCDIGTHTHAHSNHAPTNAPLVRCFRRQHCWRQPSTCRLSLRRGFALRPGIRHARDLSRG